jgi:hypothetical protein
MHVMRPRKQKGSFDIMTGDLPRQVTASAVARSLLWGMVTLLRSGLPGMACVTASWRRERLALDGGRVGLF